MDKGYYKEKSKTPIQWELNEDEENYNDHRYPSSMTNEDTDAHLVKDELKHLYIEIRHIYVDMTDLFSGFKVQLDPENPLRYVDEYSKASKLSTHKAQLWKVFNTIGSYLAKLDGKKFRVIYKSNEVELVFEPPKPEPTGIDDILL